MSYLMSVKFYLDYSRPQFSISKFPVMTLNTMFRVTAVEESLHIFVYLLLRQATVHDSLQMEFGATLCRHYSLDARLPAMVKLLSMVKVDNRMASSEKSSVKKSWSIQQSATKFVANQLRSSEGHADADISEVLQVTRNKCLAAFIHKCIFST